MAAVLVCDVAAAAARHHGRGAVLSHSDFCGLPPCLRADWRRARQCHAPVCDIRLSGGYRRRVVKRGRGDLARHVSGAANRSRYPAPLHSSGGDALAMIEGAKWRRWVFFYIPLGVFVFVLVFTFFCVMVTTGRPDSGLYRPGLGPKR